MKQYENIDLQLLKKYSKPGPRYTSYPTAPVFSDKFRADAYYDEKLIPMTTRLRFQFMCTCPTAIRYVISVAAR